MSRKQPWDECSQLWTGLWIAVDDALGSCGRERCSRWTACGSKVVIHRRPWSSTVRQQPCTQPKTGSDLRRRRISTRFTTATTTTTALSEDNRLTFISPAQKSEMSAKCCARGASAKLCAASVNTLHRDARTTSRLIHTLGRQSGTDSRKVQPREGARQTCLLRTTVSTSAACAPPSGLPPARPEKVGEGRCTRSTTKSPEDQRTSGLLLDGHKTCPARRSRKVWDEVPG